MEFATSAMGSLLPQLGELLKDEYNLEKRVKKGVRSLETELTMMHAALRKVAEVPPDQLDEQVRIWAGKVRELSYDTEDAVDAFMVRVEEGRDCEPAGANLKIRVKKFLKKATGLFTKGRALHQIAAAMEEAQDLAKQLADLRQRYGLETLNTSAGATVDPRLMAMFKDVKDLVGTDSTRDELIKMLTEGDDASEQRLRMVSIYGFGGLGKTTLANVVYQKLKAQFDCGAFVSVSQNPDAKKILKDMLYQFDEEKYEDIHKSRMDETQLIPKIKKFLQSKRYLVVIDDIWDVKAWEVIKCALIENGRGNRVITTTRLSNVAQKVGGAFELKPLCPASSKILFYGRIFGGEDKCPDQLAGVSENFLKKCGGVPLAIITVASLLASKVQDEREWKIVLDSIGAGLENSPDVKAMRKILALSYYDLPCHLKTCLLYLSVFPEDSEIECDRLIWRWIAEGFVQLGKQGTTSLFEVGESYLNELINRSMIQPLCMNDFYGRLPACRVHDMVLDLICALSSDENFVIILDGTEQSTYNSQSKVRRLSLQNSKADEATLPVSVSQVRSITLFPPAINLMPPLSIFDVLRVLDLEGCYLNKSRHLMYVGNLGHLRYLGLRNTQVGELPVEIGKLQLLQTLDLGGADISELPSSVVGLRHLMGLHIDTYTGVPNGLGALASLEELTRLAVYSPSGPDIAKELGHLTQLRMLHIEWYYGMCNRASLESLSKLSKIQILHVRGDVEPMREGWVPSPCLRTFTVEGGAFSTLPTWIKPLLHQLSDLYLRIHEVRWEDIKILGMLPSLTHLFLSATSGLIDMPVERFVVAADAFPRLRRFEFPNPAVPVPFMFPRGAMPRLQFYLFCVRASDIAANGSLDVDMGNLPSLELVDVGLWCREANAAEAEKAKAALSKDEDMDGFMCDGEKSADGDDDEDGPEKSKRAVAAHQLLPFKEEMVSSLRNQINLEQLFFLHSVLLQSVS